MNIINLTPHSINLIKNEVTTTIESSGMARCKEEEILEGFVDDIPIYKKEYGEVYGLPDPVDNTIYIVSFIVLKALNGSRNDVYTITNTARDDNGCICGFKALSKI